MSKCIPFSFTDDLVEVVPNGLYMRSVVGEKMSVGVVKFIETEARNLPVKEHSHGEEVSLQVVGGAEIFQGVAGKPPKYHGVLKTGAVVITPADEPHYGANHYDAAGVSLRINVVTPPRKDYGSKGAERVFYHPIEPDPEKPT